MKFGLGNITINVKFPNLYNYTFRKYTLKCSVAKGHA